MKAEDGLVKDRHPGPDTRKLIKQNLRGHTLCAHSMFRFPLRVCPQVTSCCHSGMKRTPHLEWFILVNLHLQTTKKIIDIRMNIVGSPSLSIRNQLYLSIWSEDAGSRIQSLNLDLDIDKNIFVDFWSGYWKTIVIVASFIFLIVSYYSIVESGE